MHFFVRPIMPSFKGNMSAAVALLNTYEMGKEILTWVWICWFSYFNEWITFPQAVATWQLLRQNPSALSMPMATQSPRYLKTSSCRMCCQTSTLPSGLTLQVLHPRPISILSIKSVINSHLRNGNSCKIFILPRFVQSCYRDLLAPLLALHFCRLWPCSQ